MRPTIVAILERLLKCEDGSLSLDAIGDAIGTEQISQAEIEELFHSLEAAGRSIDTTAPNVRQHLVLVLGEARRLRELNHSNPDVKTLASATQLTESEVRAALLYASVLGG
jgi:hypothetical protein